MTSNRISSVKLKGFAELERKLLALPEELSRVVEMEVLRNAAKPLQKAVKRRAKAFQDTGLLAKSIGLNVRRIRRRLQNQSRYTARVGPRTGFKVEKGKRIAKKDRFSKSRKRGKILVTKKGSEFTYYQDPTKYAHLVELGTSHSPAKPFIRPAVAETESQILALMAAGYDRGMAKILRKIK